MTPPHEKYLSQPDELPLVDLLRRSSIYLAGVEKELAEEAGLNTTAARALVLIVEAHKGVEAYSPTALADVLDLTTASMTAVTDKLESAGLVERRPNVADRRKICLHPTPHGTAEHQRIRDRLAAVVDAAASTLSRADRAGFRKGLLALAAL
ncbi:MarR family winged helix-turn-helix transcriptional regulator [Arthrobacter sp. RIT-PI-e]|uniref:MarR family winged helix-turn-helix transcriptional regulator n=1 Tax=Arthrobacter sp. RIT-PI-e TaxID=1681197 RepID=UPI0006760A8F|nr:MarR family transcriptional regulator [Arthrobacter sp. RIT-PI-e]